MHPYFRNDALLGWCRGQGIHVTAYSPLGSPDSASMLHRTSTATPMRDPVVQQVAQRLGRSPAQVLVRWAIQRGTSVLPKSVHAQRIKASASGNLLGACSFDWAFWWRQMLRRGTLTDVKWCASSPHRTTLLCSTGSWVRRTSGR
jgi:hypothetical protein